MHSSRNDQMVGNSGWFASIQRLPNFTGATVCNGAWMQPCLMGARTEGDGWEHRVNLSRQTL